MTSQNTLKLVSMYIIHLLVACRIRMTKFKLQYPLMYMLIFLEVKLRSKTKDLLVVYGIASLPQHPPLIPWCCLKFEEKTLPPEDYHMVYHKLSESKGQTVESIVRKYSNQVNMKALLVTANIEQRKLDTLTITCSFTVVIIPKMYKHDIAEYLQSADESLEATIAPLYSEKRDGEMFKIPVIHFNCLNKTSNVNVSTINSNN